VRTVLALMATGVVLSGCNAQPQQPASAGNLSDQSPQSEKVSYIIGLQIGRNLKQQGFEFKPDLVLRGLRDASDTSKKPQLSDSAMQAIMSQFQMDMAMQQRTKDSAAAITNKAEGDKFLAENKAKEGVKTTSSGLQYKVIKEGSGPKPKATSRVTVHYRGTLLDGKEFDSSYEHGQPVTFPLNQVIPGWTEGVQLMSKGAKYQFWIPAALCYGESGSPPAIPPNATLAFEVELIDFKKEQ